MAKGILMVLHHVDHILYKLTEVNPCIHWEILFFPTELLTQRIGHKGKFSWYSVFKIFQRYGI